MIRISNTEARKLEIVEEIGAVIKELRLTNAKALQLRGRLGFAENQILGRASRQAMHVLIDHAFHAAGDHVADDLKMLLAPQGHGREWSGQRAVGRKLYDVCDFHGRFL